MGSCFPLVVRARVFATPGSIPDGSVCRKSRRPSKLGCVKERMLLTGRPRKNLCKLHRGGLLWNCPRAWPRKLPSKTTCSKREKLRRTLRVPCSRKKSRRSSRPKLLSAWRWRRRTTSFGPRNTPTSRERFLSGHHRSPCDGLWNIYQALPIFLMWDWTEQRWIESYGLLVSRLLSRTPYFCLIIFIFPPRWFSGLAGCKVAGGQPGSGEGDPRAQGLCCADGVRAAGFVGA